MWLNLYLPSVKLLKKVHVGSKLRRVYDGPQTPFERVEACEQADRENVTSLRNCEESLDPFQLAKIIDRKLERISRLANRRLSPKAQEEARGQPGTKWPAKRLWKRRSLRELGNPFADSHFPTAATTTTSRLHIKWLDGQC